MAYFKRIFIIFIIFVLFFCKFSYCADSTVDVENTVTTNPTEYDSTNGVYHQYDNQFLTLRNLQEQSQVGFINKMYILYGNSGTQPNAKYVASLIMNDLLYAGSGTRYPIVIETNEGFKIGTYSKIDIDPVNGLFGYTYPYQDYVGSISFENVSYSNCTFSWRYMSNNNTLYPVDGVVESAQYPSAFYNVYVDNWVDMFLDFGLINSDRDKDIISKLDELISSDSGITVGQKLDTIDESVNNVNDTINNDNVDADSSTLPTDNTTDITQDGFNNIFTQLYNTFTSGTSKDLIITIPFTDKSFTINSSNVYGNANLGIVKTLINIFWYFVISYFIVQDIAKKINKIKSGNIEDIQTENIKEDLL